MSPSSGTLAERLAAIVAEFSELEPRERLELLLEYSDNLPPLAPKYQAERERSDHRVHECQTPVFLWVEIVEGGVQIVADVAPESPTVKGFVGILVETFSGATVDEGLAVEPNLVQRLGLVEALGMIRMRGLQAILFYIRKQIRERADDATHATE